MTNIAGTAGADTLVMTNGIDTVTGLNGTDKIVAGANFTFADKVDGGALNDTLILDGNYATEVAFNASTLTNVETIELVTGHTYNLKTHDNTVAANQVLKVKFTGDPALSGRLVFDGSAETNGSFELEGGSGNDVLKGGAWDDIFTLGKGGDTVYGNGGNDRFDVGAALTSGDHFDGGEGYDVVRLSGTYAQPITFGANALTSIESLHLKSGSEYVIKTIDANVAQGAQLSIDFYDGFQGRIVFDGSAETDGKFAISDSKGNDSLRGGAGDDVFWSWQGGTDTIHGGAGDDMAIFNDAYTTDDRFFGGAGYDTLVVGGAMAQDVTFQATSISSVEEIDIDKKDDGATLLTTFDGMVGAGKTLKIDFMWGGSQISQSLAFNGSDETNGRFDITGGSGNDVLIGGAGSDAFLMNKGGNDIIAAGGGDDRIEFQGAYTASDIVDGGSGSDSVHIGGAGSMLLSKTNFKNVENFYFLGGATPTIVKTADNLAALGETLHISSGYMAKNGVFTFNASAEANATFGIMTHAGSDIIYGGGGREDIDLRDGGADTIHAGGGDDLIRAMDKMEITDVFDGGSGDDMVDLNGDYAMSLGSSTIRNVEDLGLQSGHDYELYLHKDTIATGQTLNVLGYWLNADDKLLISDFGGGEGTLVVHGGKAFRNQTSAVRAGSGTEDTLHLNGDYSSQMVFGMNKLRGVELLTLGSGHSYNFVTHSMTVDSGKSLEVRGYWLGANDHLSFDGSAETNGSFHISGGAGKDTITGGAQNDEFDLHTGGDDKVYGGFGDDIFDMRDSFTAADRIDGCGGYDTVELNGQVNMILSSKTIKNIEEMRLWSGHDYTFTTKDDMLVGGKTLVVKAGTLQAGDSVVFNGAAETESSFDLRSGAGTDTLTGGTGNDIFHSDLGNDKLIGNGGADTMDGGKGNDTLTGGAGNDRFVFTGSDWGKDKITDFQDGFDKIDLSGHGFGFQDIAVSYQNGKATVDTAHGIIVLDDVSSGLTASDFIF